MAIINEERARVKSPESQHLRVFSPADNPTEHALPQLVQLMVSLGAVGDVRVQCNGVSVRVQIVQGDGESEAADTVPFVPNAVQAAVLVALDGRALTTDALASKAGCDRRQLFRKPGGLQELRDQGLINNHPRLGYYSEQAPPPELLAAMARTAKAELVEPFVPSEVQDGILKALEGRALRTDALAAAVDCDQRQLFRKPTGGLDELRRLGLVDHHSRLGYFRPDAPPPALLLATQPEPAVAQPQARHSEDYRSVNWYGTQFSFTKGQAAVVARLWQAWENDTPDISDAVLLQVSGSASVRLGDVFKDHGAWGGMITEGGTRGTHRLTEPTSRI